MVFLMKELWKVEGRKVISLQTEGLNIKRFSRITIESDLTFFGISILRIIIK